MVCAVSAAAWFVVFTSTLGDFQIQNGIHFFSFEDIHFPCRTHDGVNYSDVDVVLFKCDIEDQEWNMWVRSREMCRAVQPRDPEVSPEPGTSPATNTTTDLPSPASSIHIGRDLFVFLVLFVPLASLCICVRLLFWCDDRHCCTSKEKAQRIQEQEQELLLDGFDDDLL